MPMGDKPHRIRQKNKKQEKLATGATKTMTHLSFQILVVVVAAFARDA